MHTGTRVIGAKKNAVGPFLSDRHRVYERIRQIPEEFVRAARRFDMVTYTHKSGTTIFIDKFRFAFVRPNVTLKFRFRR